MTRKLVRAGLFVTALVGFIVAGGVVPAQDKEKKAPSIKEIMKKGHASKGLLTGIDAHAKAGEWDDTVSDAKLLKEFGVGLGKNKPPKGDADSWKKLSEKYKENTDKVGEAAEAKNAAKVTESIGLIKKSCKECHDAHKGK